MTDKPDYPEGGIRHPFSKAYYLNYGTNRVKVVLPDGSWGIFNGIGQWIEGDVFESDPELCVWMSTTRNEVSHRLSSQVGDKKDSE